ncbi:MAG: symmetrical bis(5'-nucleosyl)-tetraphosphatase [Proteobacteria bacterium]|nr:symmetrical bis(5'-nucleosyl)-tetraphosphatase [Pseudomonadota bacterium]
MNTYVIGDIQGCYRELMLLLEKIRYEPARDRLWLVGDLINRGPDNCSVMNYVMSTPGVSCVLGNHDLHFLAVAEKLQPLRRSDTIGDLIGSDHLSEYVAFLRRQPLIHHDAASSTVMVHAGLPPQLDLRTCLQLSREVEQVLQSENYRDYLAGMYGNEPDRWTDSLQGMERLRVITNYFTRMRYCTEDGQLELVHKADKQPPGYRPWFSFPRPDNLKILFGHWAALNGTADSTFAVPLDTGCIWGRALTAMRLEDGRFFSVPAQQGAS